VFARHALEAHARRGTLPPISPTVAAEVQGRDGLFLGTSGAVKDPSRTDV
jgi:hypothetical protein